MIKNFVLVFATILWTMAAIAQQPTMQRFIDQEQVVFVVNMHPGFTYNKLNKETKDKYKINELIAPMLLQFAGGQPSEEKTKKIAAQLNEPSKVGINVKDDVYVWGQRPTTTNDELYTVSDKNALMLNLVIPVTDHTKFKQFLTGLLSDQRKKEILTAGSNSTVLSNDMVVTWNSQRVILSRSTLEDNFFEDREAFQTRRSKALLQHALDLNKVDPKKSLEGNKDFAASLDKTADISFWMDYGKIFPASDALPMEVRSLFVALSELTDNTMLSGQGYFRNGEAEIKTSMSLNSAMKRVTDAAYNKGGLNKNFFKYVDKTNLMGLYGFSMDLKGFMSSYGQEIHRVLEEQDTKETRMAMNMMDIVDIFLDEEEIYDLLTGDMLVTLTDMRVVEREVSDFQYNEESNTWEEESQLVEKVMPIVNVMLSYGNEGNIRHFIDLGVNMGGLIQQEEGVWTMPMANEDLGIDFYIILKDGILMMTNDDQIAKNLNGFPAARQLPLSSVTEMSAYVMYGMLDATQISRVAQEAYASNKESMPNQVMELEKIFSKVEFKSKHPDNQGFKTNLYMRMRNQDTNALQYLLDNMETLMNSSRGYNEEQDTRELREDDMMEEKGVKRL